MNQYNRQYYWKRFLTYKETMGLTYWDAMKWIRFFVKLDWPEMAEDVEKYFIALNPIVII